MFFFDGPTKTPTPSEWRVIAAVVSGVFLLLGVTGFGVLVFAAPQKPELAAALVQSSSWSLGIGLTICFGWWLFRRLRD